jgi:two-component system, OmpR family, sensor kinase
MMSLRKATLIWVTALMVIVGAAAVAASYHFAKGETVELLDDQLHQISLVAWPSANALPRIIPEIENEVFVQIWSATGEPNQTSLINIPQQPKPGFADIEFAGESWRVYTSRDDQRTVQVAQHQSARNEIAQQAALGAALPILGALPIAWLVGVWATSRLLDRLAGFAETLAHRSIDAKDPIPLGNVPVEIAPMIAAINVLIGRHQQAVDQQRRFVSDAAHELRTPLAALQIQVDNLTTHANGIQSEAIDEMSAGVRRACTLVQQLLRMARLEDCASSSGRTDVDLKDLVAGVVADHVAVATQSDIDLGLSDNDAFGLHLYDPEARVMFANLLDNAIRYTPPGGTIDVILKRDGNDALVEIVDSGCGIPNAALPRIFDRFFRAAPPEIEGTGLGLAIAKAIADRNGFRLSVVNRQGSAGVVAQVQIPISLEGPCRIGQ